VSFEKNHFRTVEKEVVFKSVSSSVLDKYRNPGFNVFLFVNFKRLKDISHDCSVGHARRKNNVVEKRDCGKHFGLVNGMTDAKYFQLSMMGMVV